MKTSAVADTAASHPLLWWPVWYGPVRKDVAFKVPMFTQQTEGWSWPWQAQFWIFCATESDGPSSAQCHSLTWPFLKWTACRDAIQAWIKQLKACWHQTFPTQPAVRLKKKNKKNPICMKQSAKRPTSFIQSQRTVFSGDFTHQDAKWIWRGSHGCYVIGICCLSIMPETCASWGCCGSFPGYIWAPRTLKHVLL